MDIIELLASLMGLAFVSGFRLYATVFALGAGIRLGFIHLDPALFRLEILGDPMVVAVAGFMYVVEFFADKVPWIDSAWDAVHTFIRPVGAAVLAAVALGDVDPAVKFAALLLCGSVALASHAGKAGVRLVVNQSPEPFSNVGLSFVEDFVAIVAVWLAVTHPYVLLAILASWLVLLAWLLPKAFRLAWRTTRSLYRRVSDFFGSRPVASGS